MRNSIRIALSLIAGISGLALADLQDPTRPTFLGDAAIMTATEIRSDIRLSAIQIRADQRSATINGQTYREGQLIGQATVARIERDHVVIQTGENERIVYLFANRIQKVRQKAP